MLPTLETLAPLALPHLHAYFAMRGGDVATYHGTQDVGLTRRPAYLDVLHIEAKRSADNNNPLVHVLL